MLRALERMVTALASRQEDPWDALARLGERWGLRINETECRERYSGHFQSDPGGLDGHRLWARYVSDVVSRRFPQMDGFYKEMALCADGLPRSVDELERFGREFMQCLFPGSEISFPVKGRGFNRGWRSARLIIANRSQPHLQYTLSGRRGTNRFVLAATAIGQGRLRADI